MFKTTLLLPLSFAAIADRWLLIPDTSSSAHIAKPIPSTSPATRRKGGLMKRLLLALFVLLGLIATVSNTRCETVAKIQVPQRVEYRNMLIERWIQIYLMRMKYGKTSQKKNSYRVSRLSRQNPTSPHPKE